MSAETYLDMAGLRAAAQRRFTFWRGVCGCQVGALALIVTLGFRVPAMLRTPEWSWTALALEGAIALAAALTGKFLAIGGARLLLIADVALFERRMRQILPGTDGELT